MENVALIKKNLFKTKKVVSTDEYRYANFKKGESLVGVLVPYFDENRNMFDELYVSVLTLDGKKINLRNDKIKIENTRIMDSKVKEYLDKLINLSKEIHKSQKERAKFYEDLKKKEQALKNKALKQSESINKLFNQIKKAQGFVTTQDVIKALNKVLPKELEKSYWNENLFEARLSRDITFEVRFNSTEIIDFKLGKEIEVTKWCKAEDYDFIYEEYDRSYHVGDIDDSKDFKKLKSKYFKKYTKTELNKAKVEECFDACIGDKDYLIISHTLRSDLNLECRKENMKEITNRLKSLLKLL